MDPATETRRGELRAHGRRLSGTVMAYGSEALIPGIGAEKFASFAFSDYLRSGADVALNIMHEADLIVATRRGGELVLSDSPTGLAMVATLPTGDAYDSVLALVGDGLAEGLSVEFVAQQERRTGDARTILRAALPALGIVDTPAYDQSSVEIRARNRGLSGEYKYNVPKVIADRGVRRKVSFRPGAFAWQLRKFAELQEQLGTTIGKAIAEGIAQARNAYEVQLLAGRAYDKTLASLRMGTLVLDDTADALRFNVATLPATTYAADLRAGMAAGAGDFGIDLLFDVAPRDAIGGEEPSVMVPDPDNPDVQIEEIRYGLLRALAVVTRAPRGNPGSVERRRRIVTTATPRRRIWL